MRVRSAPHIDAPETTIDRRDLIQNKPFLKEVYRDWYAQIRHALPAPAVGPIVEIGSGGGFLEESLPDAITTEVFWVPHVAAVADACALPFTDDSLGALVLVDVFHHIPDASVFLTEADRCLAPGGRIIMIEPWLTPWSRFIYTCFHHEPVAPKAKHWRLEGSGPLSTANSALPWIVFHRDRDRFQAQFPQLMVTEQIPFGPMAYLLSGGLSYPSPLPAAGFRWVQRLETAFCPVMKYLAMFSRIIVEKK